MNAIPLLNFSGDEVYGATPNGLSLYWIGTSFDTPLGQAGTVENFQFWNLYQWGYFGYETNQLVIDHAVGRGDPNVLSNPNDDNLGLWSNDYMTRQEVIENADLQNLGTGIIAPTNSDIPGSTGSTDGYFTIENSYLANVVNIDERPAGSTNGNDLAPIQVVVSNDTFGQPNVSRTFDNIYEATGPFTNTYGLLQVALVYNYNGISGDDFQVYPTYVTTYGTATMPLIYGYITSIDTPVVPVGGPTPGGEPAIGSGTSDASVASSPSLSASNGNASGLTATGTSVSPTTTSNSAKSTTRGGSPQTPGVAAIAGPQPLLAARRSPSGQALTRRSPWARWAEPGSSAQPQ